MIPLVFKAIDHDPETGEYSYALGLATQWRFIINPYPDLKEFYYIDDLVLVTNNEVVTKNGGGEIPAITEMSHFTVY